MMPEEKNVVIITTSKTEYLIGIGLFLFFVGLLWSVSAINPLYSMIAAIGYFMIAGILLGVSSKLEQSEAAADASKDESSLDVKPNSKLS